MNDKYKDIWVAFLCIGTLFLVISNSMNSIWLKLIIVGMAFLFYVISLIFSIKKYNNKK